MREREAPAALAAIKFQRTVRDAVTGEPVNFIEYLNQTFTGLVCLYAAAQLLGEFPGTELTVNFGTQPGFDVVSADGGIVCECFSAASVRNNGKLKKDAAPAARRRYVSFYSSADGGEAFTAGVQERYPDVALRRAGLGELLARYA